MGGSLAAQQKTQADKVESHGTENGRAGWASDGAAVGAWVEGALEGRVLFHCGHRCCSEPTCVGVSGPHGVCENQRLIVGRWSGFRLAG